VSSNSSVLIRTRILLCHLIFMQGASVRSTTDIFYKHARQVAGKAATAHRSGAPIGGFLQRLCQ
jgi:hypothetical protein